MRDDRYKGAVLPRGVQKLCRMAEREADRGHPERMLEQALQALYSDADKEIAPQFRRRLREHDQAPRLFDASELSASARSYLEEEIARSLEAGLVVDAMEATRSALLRRAENYVREQKRRLITARNPHWSAASNAIKVAFDAAAPLAARLIFQSRRAPRLDGRVRLDEDLRAPGSRAGP